MNILSYLSEYDRDLHNEEVIFLTISVLDANIGDLTKIHLRTWIQLFLEGQCHVITFRHKHSNDPTKAL